ncbi:four helix bundle suffix domain-containing protein, partial [Myxococcota bacterium]|nr:four helix bundle suffix domain-containing protein [Myxococcota bacterium]
SSSSSSFFDEPLRSALKALHTAPAEVCANILLCLAHQASFLLFHQMERLERDFLQSGGFTERLYRLRKESQRPGKAREPAKTTWAGPTWGSVARVGMSKKANGGVR